MTTEIIINEKYKLIDDGTQYELFVFEEGGKEYKVVKTGETKISVPQWKRASLYFRTLEAACKRIVRMECSSDGSVTLKEYVERMEKVEQNIKELLSKH